VNKCIDCNKKLSSNPKAKRCGSCRTKFFHKVGICNAKGKNNSNYKNGKPRCIDCKKQFKNSSDYTERRCWSCYTKWSKIPQNNANWHGGISKEGYFKFNKELKLIIRTRDSFKCQNCGMSEKEHLNIYKKVLDVHHIDYNKKNCSKKNLIALCHQCNIRANYNRNYWKLFYNSKMIIIKTNIYLKEKKGE